jgi:hypothetical protein
MTENRSRGHRAAVRGRVVAAVVAAAVLASGCGSDDGASSSSEDSGAADSVATEGGARVPDAGGADGRMTGDATAAGDAADSAPASEGGPAGDDATVPDATLTDSAPSDGEAPDADAPASEGDAADAGDARSAEGGATDAAEPADAFEERAEDAPGEGASDAAAGDASDARDASDAGDAGDAERQLAAPVFTPPDGTPFLPGTAVTITCPGLPANGFAFYTTDGTIPTHTSPVYSGPLPVVQPETIHALCTAPGWADSTIASATYVSPTCASVGQPCGDCVASHCCVQETQCLAGGDGGTSECAALVECIAICAAGQPDAGAGCRAVCEAHSSSGAIAAAEDLLACQAAQCGAQCP